MLNFWKTVPIRAVGWIAAQTIMKVVAKLFQFNVEGMTASPLGLQRWSKRKKSAFKHSPVWPTSWDSPQASSWSPYRKVPEPDTSQPDPFLSNSPSPWRSLLLLAWTRAPTDHGRHCGPCSGPSPWCPPPSSPCTYTPCRTRARSPRPPPRAWWPATAAPPYSLHIVLPSCWLGSWWRSAVNCPSREVSHKIALLLCSSTSKLSGRLASVSFSGEQAFILKSIFHNVLEKAWDRAITPSHHIHFNSK